MGCWFSRGFLFARESECLFHKMMMVFCRLMDTWVLVCAEEKVGEFVSKKVKMVSGIS